MPAAVVRHLGFDVDALNHRIVLPHDKQLSIASRCRQVLSQACTLVARRRVPRRRLASLVGYLQSAYPAVPFARFFLRELHACLNSTSDWNAAVLLSSGARRELNTFWRRLDQHAHCTPWHRPLTSVILCTDASTCGWGAWLRTHSQPVHFYQHHWQTGELYTLASNHLKLMAVY